MGKRKILLCVPSLMMGGMERVLVTYANLLFKKGYDVTVSNYSGDDPAIVGDLEKGIHYIRNNRPVPNILHAGLHNLISFNFRVVPYDKWLQIRKTKTLHKKVIKENYDAEIAFFGAESIRLVSGCRNSNTKTVCWIHNENMAGIFNVIKTEKQRREVFSKIDSIICVSKKVEENMRKEIPWHIGITTLYNPNDTEQIRKLSQETQGLPLKEKFTFVMVCRLSLEHKGLDRMLNAVQCLENKYDFNLWLVGEGPGRAQIEKEIYDKNIRSITVFGQQSNPYKYMAAADVFLCTSRYEGFSLVMSEALSLGKVILTTDVSGAREMLGDSEYGYIVENDEQAIVKGMEAMLSNKTLFNHYQGKVRERVNFCSESEILKQFEKIVWGNENV